MPNSPQSGPIAGPTIAELTHSYRTSSLTPSEVIDQVLGRIAERGEDGTWISVLDRGDLMIRAKELEQQVDPASLPLYGIPFGVKDSIDVAGVATTLACPDYSYQATATAPVVARLTRKCRQLDSANVISSSPPRLEPAALIHSA